MARKLELAVILPVYNEEGAIDKVIGQWDQELKRLKISFKIFAYDDGSTDNTPRMLDKIASKNDRIQVIHKNNSGHGPTVLQGYLDHSYADWIFQVDSDDEMTPERFEELWKARTNVSFVIGSRASRESALLRRIITGIARWVVHHLYGVDHPFDVNCPYRLMKADIFRPFLHLIPTDAFAPNVLVSGIVARYKIPFHEIPVIFHTRKTGEVSIKRWKLFRAVVKSFYQAWVFRRRLG